MCLLFACVILASSAVPSESASPAPPPAKPASLASSEGRYTGSHHQQPNAFDCIVAIRMPPRVDLHSRLTPEPPLASPLLCCRAAQGTRSLGGSTDSKDNSRQPGASPAEHAKAHEVHRWEANDRPSLLPPPRVATCTTVPLPPAGLCPLSRRPLRWIHDESLQNTQSDWRWNVWECAQGSARHSIHTALSACICLPRLFLFADRLCPLSLSPVRLLC